MRLASVGDRLPRLPGPRSARGTLPRARRPQSRRVSFARDGWTKQERRRGRPGRRPRGLDLESGQGAVSRSRDTPSSTSCATTSRSPRARCAAPAAGRTCWCAIPNGIGGEFFYQKRAPASRPPWIEVVSLRFPSGRSAEEVVPRDAAALAWMANLACLELHPHPVRAEDLDHPDELRVDLDPVPGVDVAADPRRWRASCDATLRDFGLIGWPKTSGSRGMHVNVRIERRWTFDEVRRAALALAREVERRAPALATSKWWKEERHGVFVDYNQNAKDRTVAVGLLGAADARCARVGAADAGTRSTRCDPGDFTLATMPARFAEIGDRHAGIDEHAGSLERAARALGAARARGPGRRALAAALPEAGRRAAARAAVAAPRVEAPADRDRARPAQGGRARRARALEGAPSRGGRASRAGRRAGRRDARPLVHLDAHPRQPAARARASCGRRRSRSTRTRTTCGPSS